MSTASVGAPAFQSACCAPGEFLQAGISGVPVRKNATGSVSMICRIWPATRSCRSLRSDAELVDVPSASGAASATLTKLVLLDQQPAVERARDDGTWKWVAAGAVVHGDLGAGKAWARSVRIVSVAMGDDGDGGLPDRLPHVVPGARAARRGRGETVRRHPALVSLSEEHQQELAHARRLLRAAGAGSEERLAVASAYVDAFFMETVEHFRREEEILFPLYVRHAGSTPLLERILREHMELHGLVRALRAEAVAGDIPPEALRTLGGLLRDHVRVEERELFEEIERIVPAAELERVRL